MNGFEPEPRYEITNAQKERMTVLVNNIGMQRQKQVSILPGFM